MSSNLEDWETQKDAKHTVAHKGGPLTFLDGGGTVASRRQEEEHRASDALSQEAGERRKKLVAANMKSLRDSKFPDEIAYFRDALRKLNLTSAEEAELREILWAKIR